MIVFIEAAKEFTGLTAVTCVFLIAAFILVAFNRTVERKARNAFLVCLATLFCIALADWFSYITEGKVPELRYVHAVLMALTFAIAPVLPAAIAQTIYPTRSIRWVMIILSIHAVFELISIACGFVFWVDANNIYHRGTFYPVYMAVYSFSSAYLIIETFRAARAYQTAQIAVVFGILICMFTGVIIQIFDSTVRMTWPATSMAVVLFFQFYSDMVLRTDALTKLLNRRSYEEALAHPSLPCIAVVIDIDDFKSVNDIYGHAYGDKCLIQTARLIRHSLGNAGLCFRTGGDEFAVIVTKRLDEIEALCSELKELSSHE